MQKESAFQQIKKEILSKKNQDSGKEPKEEIEETIKESIQENQPVQPEQQIILLRDQGLVALNLLTRIDQLLSILTKQQELMVDFGQQLFFRLDKLASKGENNEEKDDKEEGEDSEGEEE